MVTAEMGRLIWVSNQLARISPQLRWLATPVSQPVARSLSKLPLALVSWLPTCVAR